MKVGVFTVLYGQKPLKEALEHVKRAGVQAVEIGLGNYPGTAHGDAIELAKDPKKIAELGKAVEKAGLEISALSCHGNPLHPNKEIAERHHAYQRATIEVASQLGVQNVIGFSGCPGSHDGDKYPNWVTCAWPPDFLEVLEWQWKEKVIPYWRQEAEFARSKGVRWCLEMHPGFVVYNPETLLKLRQECGETIGANLDPSHLFWQGIDPVEAVRALKGAIFHVHAKDTWIEPANTRINGVLDTKTYRDLLGRSWLFRTVGYGHDEGFWRAFISTLKAVGYDGVLSIEHEDALMSVDEGFQKAVDFLNRLVIREKPAEMWWA
jgi:sugar phosphate isomerase/epimerase